tara:strand:+ start:1481 stop:2557 length:1077 start_codon:yes stop_codon:yes gene_type:complete
MKLTYKKLGLSDLNVSNICLGTMTFGEQTSKSEAFKIMDYAFENGINFFDTAEMYPIYPKKETQGLTEKIIGEWMHNKKNRKKITIASKICSNHPKGVGATELKWIRGGGKNLKFDKKNFDLAIDESLTRLKTDYIDLYQLHWPERLVPIFGQLDFIYEQSDIDWTPILEILQNLEDLKKIGKIRNFGLSNETAWGLLKYINTSEVHKLTKPASIQNGYNLLNRVFDISLSEVSIRENCGLLAYSPLAGGRLSGKYLNGERPNEARYTLWPGRFSRHHTLKGEKAIKKYLSLSQKYNLNLTDLSNAFVLSRPYLTSSIFGVTSLEQLKNNLNCLNIELTNDLLGEINRIHVADPNPCV